METKLAYSVEQAAEQLGVGRTRPSTRGHTRAEGHTRVPAGQPPHPRPRVTTNCRTQATPPK
jgi:hypothetical protein